MSLPKIATPKYNLTVPSTGKIIEYRPFLVKEEKILLIANETGDQNQIMKAIHDVLADCTFNHLDISALTSFDFEYIFLNLRAKSVGETSKVGIACRECNGVNDVEIKLDEIIIKQSDIAKINKQIQLTDDIGVHMKYMNVADMISISIKSSLNDKIDLTNDTIIAFIDSIYDKDQIYPVENSTREELDSFINSLNRSHMQKIEEYISQIPQCQYDVKFECKHCKAQISETIKGVQSFFE